MNKGRGQDPFDPVYGLPHGGIPSAQPTVPYQPPPPLPPGGDLSNDWESDDKTFTIADVPIWPKELDLFTTKRPHRGLDVHISDLPIQNGTGAYQIRVYAVTGPTGRVLVDSWASTGLEGPQLAVAARFGPVRWQVSITRTDDIAGAPATLSTPATCSFSAGPFVAPPKEVGVSRALHTVFGAQKTTVVSFDGGITLGMGLADRELAAIELTNVNAAQRFAMIYDGNASTLALLAIAIGVPANSSRYVEFPHGQVAPGGRTRSSFANNVRIETSSTAPAFLAATGLTGTVWLK